MEAEELVENRVLRCVLVMPGGRETQTLQTVNASLWFFSGTGFLGSSSYLCASRTLQGLGKGGGFSGPKP